MSSDDSRIRIEGETAVWIVWYSVADPVISFKIFQENLGPVGTGSVVEEEIAEGRLKWDGCLDILFHGPNFMHFCGPEREPIIGKAFAAIYALGPKMFSWIF